LSRLAWKPGCPFDWDVLHDGLDEPWPVVAVDLITMMLSEERLMIIYIVLHSRQVSTSGTSNAFQLLISEMFA